jgi:hypothetical protein
MGYSLSIGEAACTPQIDEYYDEDADSYEFYNKIVITVKPEKHDDAPAFGEPTDYTNKRWPSYTSWADFSEFCDLENFLFHSYGNKEITGGHPGHFIITKMYVDGVMKKYHDFKKKYPNAVASFDGDPTYHDMALCRFEWLVYWLQWALKNCKTPVFCNT